MKNYWMTKLAPFDGELMKMVESLTGMPCEPKNGGDHYFFEADYRKHNDPQYILAIWDAITGRAGDRLISIRDDADRQTLLARIKFAPDICPESAYLPIRDNNE